MLRKTGIYVTIFFKFMFYCREEVKGIGKRYTRINRSDSMDVIFPLTSLKRRTYWHAVKLYSVKRMRIITVMIGCSDKVPRLLRCSNAAVIASLICREVFQQFISNCGRVNVVLLVGGLYEWCFKLLESATKINSQRIYRRKYPQINDVHNPEHKMATLSDGEIEKIVTDAINTAMQDVTVISAFCMNFILILKVSFCIFRYRICSIYCSER